ncbi:YheV family putative zinc ribbon protein [Pectobacteriaceae bacterium CE90]|nr:YheV family putative zinc ribbon protein [Prodigiosinella sp. LS101]WJV53582.1 YheV family putative zinc ribbon protein [Prodigiosinella sp. LS101]WJV57941.1 YheV family putative zinc ribbon protein [Pectobacteriaceae bacterium C111]WJY15423.1 YheV family putative zinc ribbon protein [Pectobacteriaceae bacterium CE90]
MATIRKRFIAGAVCPQCHSQDTLAVGREDETDVVICVKCGYHQRQSEESLKAITRPDEKQIIGIFHPE